jgi:DNA-binding transcriptional regulator YhcF (GntR family)
MSNALDAYFDRADVKEFWAFRDYLRASSLSTAARLVAVDVWFHMRIAHLEASPTRATLAKNTGLSESTVKRALAEIRECAFFSVTGGVGRSQRYTFRLVVPQKTLFELREMLSEKPKNSSKRAEKKGSICTLIDQQKGSNTLEKGVKLNPEYNLEYKLTDDDACEGGQNLIDEDALRAMLFAAAGEAISHATRQRLGNLATPRKWLATGHDLREDILPAVRAVAARAGPGTVHSWEYFSREVVDARDHRVSPLPAARTVRPVAVVDLAERRRIALVAAEAVRREHGFV